MRDPLGNPIGDPSGESISEPIGDLGDGGSDRPVVAIWRTNWLPASETFIRNQIEALQRWSPLLIGLRRVPDGLPIEPDLAPFDLSLTGRIRQRTAGAVGYRGVYDGTLRRRRARLIHAHFGPGGIHALPIARRLEIPLMVTFHGFDATSLPAQTGAAGRRYRSDLRRLFDGAARLLAVSEFIADRLVALGAPREKVTVHHIGTPISPAPISPAPATRGPTARESAARLPAARPPAPQGSVILFVGRLRRQKGLDQLLDAVAMLPGPVRDPLQVRIVGYGELADHLHRRIDAERLPVTMLGRLGSDQVREQLDAAAIFCAPSVSIGDGAVEGFGMVYLEAALQGLPVVAFHHGGVGEAVLDEVTGLLAPEGDVAQLSGLLLRLLSDPPLRRRLGEAGRERVRRHFDIRAQTAVLEQIYDQVAAGR